MKLFHNGNFGKVAVLLFAIAMHGFLSAGAFFVGELLASILFVKQPGMQIPFAIGYAIAVFLGAMWTFIYSEYAHEDVRAYAQKIGKPGYVTFFWVVLVGVMGSELASVLYRTWQTDGIVDQAVVLAIGIFALLVTFSLGKVLHAIVNAPIDLHMERAQHEVGRDIVSDTIKHKDKMSIEEKKRFIRGDLTGLAEARDRTLAEQYDDEQMKLRAKQDKERDKRAKAQNERSSRERAQKATQQLYGYEPIEPEYPFGTTLNKTGEVQSQSNGHKSQ